METKYINGIVEVLFHTTISYGAVTVTDNLRRVERWEWSANSLLPPAQTLLLDPGSLKDNLKVYILVG